MAAAILTSSAQAQEPDRTLDSYGAWELRCQRIAAPDVNGAASSDASTEAATVQACEVLQTVQLEGQAQPLTQLAIGRPTENGGLVAVAQLPLGLWLPMGVTLDLQDDAGPYALELRRCTPGGCFAEIALTDAMLAVLRDDVEGQSAISFAIQPDDPARVPLVHAGFAAALDALDRRMQVVLVAETGEEAE